MYQVQESLREARMLAISQKRSVRVEFSAADNSINVLIMAADDLDELDDTSWADISVTVERAHDPSAKLGDGHKFITWSSSAATATDVSRIAYAPNISDDIAAAGGALMFRADGTLTDISDIFSPINGTVFIGPGESDPLNRLARAVTILGATGRINGWRWRNGEWQSSK
jgi:hypothetical protein